VPTSFAVARRSQMIYFVFVASVLGQQVSPNGAVIELTGQTPRVIYGQLDASDALTLTRNASEDKLVCSGEFEAADLRIAGTSTTVADLMQEVAALRQEMAAVKAFVGMMPPPPTFQWHAGDLAVVGLQTKQAASDSRDFAIAVLREGGMPAGASFFVTDRGVTDACAFSTVEWEGTLQYTAPTALPQGTIITWSGDGAHFVEVESQISDSQGTFWLWESGDQLIVYATSSTYDAPPTFIFAVQSTSTQWQSGSSIETDFRVSALPCGLVNGATALTHGKGAGVDPWGAVWYVYTAGDCVTQSGCLAAVANVNNWVGSDDTSSYAPVAALP
jgi:hypothetical protein